MLLVPRLYFAPHNNLLPSTRQQQTRTKLSASVVDIQSAAIKAFFNNAIKDIRLCPGSFKSVLRPNVTLEHLRRLCLPQSCANKLSTLN